MLQFQVSDTPFNETTPLPLVENAVSVVVERRITNVPVAEVVTKNPIPFDTEFKPPKVDVPHSTKTPPGNPKKALLNEIPVLGSKPDTVTIPVFTEVDVF